MIFIPLEGFKNKKIINKKIFDCFFLINEFKDWSENQLINECATEKIAKNPQPWNYVITESRNQIVFL